MLIVQFYIFFIFLGPHLQHVSVPWLGFKLELQLLAYTTATTMPNLIPVFSLHCSSWPPSWTLNTWGIPGFQPLSSWILVRFLTHWATASTPNSDVFNSIPPRTLEMFSEAIMEKIYLPAIVFINCQLLSLWRSIFDKHYFQILIFTVIITVSYYQSGTDF